MSSTASRKPRRPITPAQAAALAAGRERCAALRAAGKAVLNTAEPPVDSPPAPADGHGKASPFAYPAEDDPPPRPPRARRRRSSPPPPPAPPKPDDDDDDDPDPPPRGLLGALLDGLRS